MCPIKKRRAKDGNFQAKVEESDFSFLFFSVLYPRHMEVLRLGV